MRIKRIDRDDPGDLLTQNMDLNGAFIFKPLAMGRDYRIATTATVMVNDLSMKIGFRTIVLRAALPNDFYEQIKIDVAIEIT